MRNEKDLGSKWYVEHHGDSVFKLANLPSFDSWRPEPTDKVLPRRIPDGLFAVKFTGHTSESPVLLEIESEPNVDASRQILEDILLVRLERGVFPDAILVLLKPRGKADVAGTAKFESHAGTVSGLVNWKVIRLWEYQAEDLFAMNDPGLIPWITLTQTSQPPEEFLNRCRDVIDQQVPVAEREEMLVVTSIFAGIRYDDRRLLNKFLRSDHRMIESATIQMLEEMAIERRLKKMTVKKLTNRFGTVSEKVIALLDQIKDEAILEDLFEKSITCPSLDAFVECLKK